MPKTPTMSTASHETNCCRDHALIIKLLIIKTVLYVVIRLVHNKYLIRFVIECQYLHKLKNCTINLSGTHHLITLMTLITQTEMHNQTLTLKAV